MNRLFVVVVLVVVSSMHLVASEKFIQLKNSENGFVVIEFLEGEIRFHDPILKEEMETNGVTIPLSERERYGGKEHILLGDKQFQEAFQEFYYTYAFNPDLYKWE